MTDRTEALRDQIHRATREAYARGTEDAARVAEAWLKSGRIQLHAGEMTAQELRSVKAVVSAISKSVRSLAKEST